MPFYEKKTTFLIDYNTELMLVLLKLLGIKKENATSLDVYSIYEEIYGFDLEKNPNLYFEK